MSKKIVYVTGCLGFIGSHVTEACLEKGWYVIGVDKCTYASNEGWIDSWSMRYGDHFNFLKTDINDLDRIYDCDYIINLAAETHVDNSIEDSDAFVHSNIDGVHHLLKMINKKKWISEHLDYIFWVNMKIILKVMVILNGSQARS